MQLDLHIGAHKTGTSWLQQVFQGNQAALLSNGIKIPHHRKTRKFVTVPCQLKAYQRLGQDWNTKYTDQELQTIIDSYILSLRGSGARRVVLSDENMLGHCGHIVRGGMLYSRKQAFLGVLAEFLPRPPRRIFISVRDYSAFFSAVYGQFLLDVLPENYVSAGAFTETVLGKYPNWANVLRKVAETFPKSEIVYWTYEDAKDDWRPVLTAIGGRKLARAPKTKRGDVVRPSMTQSTYDRFIALASELGTTTALKKMKHLRETDPDSGAGSLRIFSSKEQETLQDRYARHVAQIADIPNTTRLSWDAPAKATPKQRAS
ncbi:MAG: hypothetical protein AAF092_06775 [Pseudomonadota bacterium]